MSEANLQPPYFHSHTSVDQKIKARACALMLKNGSPKLREILRENYRVRIKESRANSYLSSRTQLINQIVKHELANEIENDIQLQENILNEIFQSWEEWQKEEYERQFISIDDDVTQIFCPVCEVHLLDLTENIISCNCGLRLYYPKSLNEFYVKVMTNVKNHELQCSRKLIFFTEPKDGFNVLALNSCCFNCNYNVPIVELI